jgi:hypothetical protein
VAPDFQTVYNIVMALGVPIAGVIWKLATERIKDAETKAHQAAADLAAYKLHVSETYLAIKRFEGFEERLFGELKAIRERLDDKADK